MKKVKYILGITIILLIISFSVLMYFKFNNKSESENVDNVEIKNIDGEDYYLITDDYSNECDIIETEITGVTETKMESFKQETVMTYDEYKEYTKKWNLNKKYNDAGSNYAVVAEYEGQGIFYHKPRLANVNIKENSATLYIWDGTGGPVAMAQDTYSAYAIIVPVSKEVTNLDIVGLIDDSEIYDIENNIETIYKPIIYLYPTEEMDVTVKLLKPESITHSYPKYVDLWRVHAKEDGTLIDKNTNNELYALYYENKNNADLKMTDEGFIVKGEDVSKFLEEKLALLGLNYKEREEFIIYWLPKLESNKYNYIRFATPKEINENMPIEVTPKPDTTIRVLMIYKPLDNFISVKEQALTTPERKGFTLVEWGGTEID